MTTRQFLLMWDCYGLETVADYTEYSQAKMWQTLQGVKDDPHDAFNAPSFPSLNALMMRARYNSQRNYEIYAVEAQEGITREDLIQMFEDSPQHAAELIRERGYCIFNGRETTQRVIT